MTFPYGEPITVKRAGSRYDAYSDTTVEDWSLATTSTITGCVIFPARSVEEPSVDKASVITGVTILAPAGSDIRRKDQVSYRGGPFREVVGEPFDWRHPMTGWNPGMGVELEGETR